MFAYRLPSELIEEVIGFVLRPDWRTCKRHEANLIKEFNGCVSYYLEETKGKWVSWDSPSFDEIENWTLYGRNWLMNAHEWFIIAQGGRPPLIPPRDGMYQDNYWKWYSHMIMWMNY